MYAIVQINTDRLVDDIVDDIDFAMKLVEEENVFVLPGSSFGSPGTFRVAFTSSEDTLQLASSRIASFCRRHTKQASRPGMIARV
jgi:tyrosine aminotransferase